MSTDTEHDRNCVQGTARSPFSYMNSCACRCELCSNGRECTCVDCDGKCGYGPHAPRVSS